MANLLKITWLGGMNEIGASSALIETIDDLNNQRNLLIDSGVRMKNEKNGSRLISRSEGHTMPSQPIHAILATHAHNDHVGFMPHMIKANPQVSVFMTRPTLHIAGMTYLDTLRLMDDGKIEADLDKICAFGEGARIIVKDNKQNMIEKPGWVNLFSGIDAYFGPNGHIRGSAFIVLKIGGKMIMFSGDISVYDSPTVKGMIVPEQFIGRLDAIFIESTYGNREFEQTRDEEERRMVRLAIETIRNDGSCLFPAFGIGRSPDVFIAQLIGGVDPLFLDGMGRKILDIYAGPDGYWSELDQSSGIDLINDPRIQMVRDRADRQEIIYSRMPFSVVTTAGMMIEGSCAWQYATSNHFLEKPQNLFGQTGYQAEYTEGRVIEGTIEGGKEINLAGYRTTVRARVVKLGLSSHASGMQLTDIVMKLKPKKTFINHGTEEGREGLKNNLLRSGYQGEIHKPKNMEPIEI